MRSKLAFDPARCSRIAVSAALVFVAGACASTQKLVERERWSKVCERGNDPEHETEVREALLSRLDATIEIEMLPKERILAALGEEGLAFAEQRPLVLVTVEARRFDEYVAYDDYREASVTLYSVEDDGRVSKARSYWDPPEPEAGGAASSRTSFGDFTRAMGALFGTVIGVPIEVGTLGRTSFGIREGIEAVADTAANGIEAADALVDGIAAAGGEEQGPAKDAPNTFDEALARLLEERVCAEKDGRRTCAVVRYLEADESKEGAPDELRVHYEMTTHDSRDICWFIRFLRVPLPEGADLSARIARLFENGPISIAKMEPVEEE